jgi:hypothetical protein
MMRGVLLGVFVTALLTSSVAAPAGDPAPGLQQVGEWSSASKPKRKRAAVVYPDSYPPHRFGWRGADPSFDQDGRPYRNPFPGQCMVDLGYGRFESCDQVGGR